MAQRLASTTKAGKAKQTQAETNGQELQLQIARRHDPAEAIMEGIRHLITTRGRQLAHACLNKSDVENQAYLFKAALSEIRTEVQVRGRNDAAGLRSITTLLQREVDALEQKMKEDVERLKHDIQVDMNNRKAESKEEQTTSSKRFRTSTIASPISLSDLKTEIEQNVKWDATRRSLFLVFGIAAIVAANLAIADYLTRDDEAAKAAASKEVITAGNPPASTNAGAPASLGWATEVASSRCCPSCSSSQTADWPQRFVRRCDTCDANSRAVCQLWLLRVFILLRLLIAWAQSSHLRLQCQLCKPSDYLVLRRWSVKIIRLSFVCPTLMLSSNCIQMASRSRRRSSVAAFRFDHVWLRDACQAPHQSILATVRSSFTPATFLLMLLCSTQTIPRIHFHRGRTGTSSYVRKRAYSS